MKVNSNEKTMCKEVSTESTCDAVFEDLGIFSENGNGKCA